MSKVYRGRRGWLFHGQGNRRWIDLLCGMRSISEEVFAEWRDHISRFEYMSTSSRKIFAVVPEKHTALYKYLPLSVKPALPFPLQLFDLKMDGTDIYVSLFHELNSRSAENYLKTDSHWSAVGAFRAYQVICEKLGVTPLTEGDEVTFLRSSKRFSGDLARGDLSGCFEFPILPRFSTGISILFDNKLPRIGQCFETKCARAKNNSKIVVFGNSFSKFYFLDYVSRTFVDTVYFFSPSPDLSLIQEYSPDYLVLQTNERFLDVSPSYFDLIPFRARALFKWLNREKRECLRSVDNTNFLGALLHEVIEGNPQDYLSTSRNTCYLDQRELSLLRRIISPEALITDDEELVNGQYQRLVLESMLNSVSE
jgi:hypothetical protein